MSARIDWNVDGDTESPVLHIARPLTETEVAVLRLLFKDVWDDGYDSCLNERDRQEHDPSYPLHRRNPYEDA